ncbi:MAG: ribonuclease Z [Candidatus Aenigmarchaeota archaeon]|nr:ribonuclease Z [Candidatus Aenigmarchaeota archaeon]
MTVLDVTFLGTTAGIPTPKRNHAAIYLRYQSQNEYAYLFDCGEGTQRQLFIAKLNFFRINDIFITHWHADHCAGLLGLLETMNLEGRKKPLRIFGPEAERFVDLFTEIGYSTKDFDITGVDVPHEGSAVTPLVENDEFMIASIPVKHHIPAVAYGFIEKDRLRIDTQKAKKFGLPEKGLVYKHLKKTGVIEFKGKTIHADEICDRGTGKKVIYTGDTMPCPNIASFAANADLLIHDSTFFTESLEKEYRHSTVADVLGIAAKANAKQVVLTHISRRYQDTQELKKMIAGHEHVKLAKDFMTITLT